MIGASYKFTDLKSYSVTIDGSDVTTGVMEMHIWQDISTPAWSIALTFSDTTNMIMKIPIKQGSKINVNMSSDSAKSLADGKSFSFVLYKISGRDRIKSKHQSYTVHGISEKFIKNQEIRIQKHFDKKPNEIVQEIVQEHLSGSMVLMTQATDKVSVIIPNMTPYAAISWLSQFAVYNNAADYCFFMSKEREYKFKSFEDMYTSDDSGYTFKQGLANKMDDAGNLVESDVFNMLHYQIEHYDALSNAANGMYASETLMFDVHKQVWTKKEFKYGDDVNMDKSMSAIGEPFKSIKPAIYRSFTPVNDMMRGDDGEEDHPNKKKQVETYAGSRRSNMMKFEQDKLYIQLAGQVKYAEDLLGKTVMIDMHSQEDVSGENLDKYYSGKYLVTAIEHVMSNQEYYVNLEVIKKRLKRPM